MVANLLERFQHFYERLRQLPRLMPAVVGNANWCFIGGHGAGAGAERRTGGPYAFPPAPPSVRINGTDCDLANAIVAANTDTATGGVRRGHVRRRHD